MSLEEKLKQLISENEQMMKDLKLVRDLDLPDCYIAAGYIRNYIWDRLHGFNGKETHNDIDVIYFDIHNSSEEIDSVLEQRLVSKTLNEKWSVKNQARMHVKNGDNPYKSTIDAVAHWPETVTSIGVRLDNNNELQIIAPYGLQDLFDMVVRRTDLFQDKDYYLNRVKGKDWTKNWPLLTLIED
jgi:hypothetical protein